MLTIKIAASHVKNTMQITIELPNDIAERLAQRMNDLPKQTLEALAIEGYRSEVLSDGDVARLLHLSSREVKALLEKANAYSHETEVDTARARETSQSLKRLPTIAETFDDIRKICVEEDFDLELPLRQDRPNPLMTDDVSF